MRKPSLAKIDALWAKIVKDRAGWKCEVCGKGPDGLNAHHIFSRSNRSTRWDIENSACLCVNHHAFGNFSAHKAPVEFVEWLKEHRGEQWYQDLRRRAAQTLKPDYVKIKAELDAIDKVINSAH